jgi:hypothetical protein
MNKRIGVALILASGLWAASPFAGTWKLDPAKTKYTAGAPPQDETLVIAAGSDDRATITVTGTTASGRPISIRYSVPDKGGAAQIEESPCDGLTMTRISENVSDSVCIRGGKQIATRHTVISEDGKTMRATVDGIDPLGRRVSGVEVYEKQ